MNSECDNTMVAELIDNVYLRYRRNKTHGNTTKQVEHQSRGFNNGALTNQKQHSIKYKKSTGRWNLHMIFKLEKHDKYRCNIT
jgi:hypothetical protein